MDENDDIYKFEVLEKDTLTKLFKIDEEGNLISYLYPTETEIH